MAPPQTLPTFLESPNVAQSETLGLHMLLGQPHIPLSTPSAASKHSSLSSRPRRAGSISMVVVSWVHACSSFSFLLLLPSLALYSRDELPSEFFPIYPASPIGDFLMMQLNLPFPKNYLQAHLFKFSWLLVCYLGDLLLIKRFLLEMRFSNPFLPSRVEQSLVYDSEIFF